MCHHCLFAKGEGEEGKHGGDSTGQGVLSKESQYPF